MNPLYSPSEGVFPLSLGTPSRPSIRPPQLVPHLKLTPVHVLGNRAFLRAWAARRAVRALAVGGVNAGQEQRPLAT